MRPKNIAMTLLMLSVALTCYLIVGSFVSYAPSIDRSELQNIYIGRIVSLGSVIALLQVVAIIAVFVDGESASSAKQ